MSFSVFNYASPNVDEFVNCLGERSHGPDQPDHSDHVYVGFLGDGSGEFICVWGVLGCVGCEKTEAGEAVIWAKLAKRKNE
jgi:hypothetical protein